MRRPIIKFVTVVCAGALLSGCFALRGFEWRDGSIRPGGGTSALLTLRPGASTSTTDIPFVLVGLPKDQADGTTSLRLGRGVFDLEAEFTGPRKMIADAALRDFATTPGTCTQGGDLEPADAALITNVAWRLRRVPQALADGGRLNDAALTRLAVSARTDAPAGTKEIAFFSGRWADDGDGVPEDPEVSCTGLMFTSLPVVAPPKSSE